MLGICYLLLAVLTGNEITKVLLVPETGEKRNRIWVWLPVSFGVGTLLMTWILYVISWLLSVYAGQKTPLFAGNILVMGGVFVWLMILYLKRRKKARQTGKMVQMAASVVSNKVLFQKECIFYGILLLVITFLMFYVFCIKGNVLYSGFTVFGDYAPHTAMIRSFSWGNNFPTQYPHYGGEDVKYHFMFQFLTGNLEYLGLRMDLAYNGVSIFSLWGFLVLLCQLTRRITGRIACEVLGVVLFFFRSGCAFFQFLAEHLKAGDLWSAIADNTSFIGYTANENWGLWNFNVYLNQRHLAFGLLLVTAAIWIYLDWLEAGIAHEVTGWRWMIQRIFSKEAWRSRRLETALLLGMLLGLCAFWNGAALIGGLLILCGFAVFSDGKLDYAVTAGTAILFSVIQSKIFISGEAMSASFYWGFLAEDKSPAGVVSYLFWMSGIYFLGLVVLGIWLERRERVILISFCFPAVFAFCMSLTPDINVNHKYIMISYAFLTMFWASALITMFQRRWVAKTAAALLAICLTLTGAYDMVIILRGNDASHRVAVNTQSDLSKWLAESLSHTDLILTPEYSMNEVTMAGVMLYCGWPYYAWSAGYDTNYRAKMATEIYTTENVDTLQEIVKKEKITYILFEDGSQFEQQECKEELIAQTYSKVYTSEDGRIRIYET